MIIIFFKREKNRITVLFRNASGRKKITQILKI